jgi:2-polyprenyl-3-methyl-5-hydroxy-6-metoxy-1,4-benzoquinol methylase
MTREAPVDDVSRGWNAVARDFIARRSPVTGVSAIRRWAASIPTGGSILDLGCGHGIPISSALIESGFSVYGVDAAPNLVLEFRRRLPQAQVACEAVETSTFFDRRFDAAIAIGLMFLLDDPSQRQLISRVSGALYPGGALLFTAPMRAASWTDLLTGQESRSLGREAYETVLRNSGLELIEEFADEGENHYYSARKIEKSAPNNRMQVTSEGTDV